MRILLIGVVLTLHPIGHAQSAPANANDRSASERLESLNALDGAVVRQRVEAAKELAQTRNIAAAEEQLATLNRAKPNTAAWHLETAQRLMQTAEQLAREGEPGNIAVIANRALVCIDHAVAVAKDARSKAVARTLAGDIQERYLADSAAALASYRSAAEVSPATATKAKLAVARLERTESELAEKVAGASR